MRKVPLIAAQAHRVVVEKMPLDILLETMGDPTMPLELRLVAAVRAAPYYHAKVSVGPPKASFEMTEAELETATRGEKEHTLRQHSGQAQLWSSMPTPPNDLWLRQLEAEQDRRVAQRAYEAGEGDRLRLRLWEQIEEIGERLLPSTPPSLVDAIVAAPDWAAIDQIRLPADMASVAAVALIATRDVEAATRTALIPASTRRREKYGRPSFGFWPN
jgi:hypothetical protein